MWAIILETCFGMAEKVYHVPANKGRTTALQIKLIRSQCGKKKKKRSQWEGNFPGSPVAKIPCSQGRAPRFDP